MGTNATKKAASKIVAFLLAALMLVSVMPMTAFAAPKANIVVEGLTVTYDDTFKTEYDDNDTDDKTLNKLDQFSFNGLTIWVTYRSLDQIEQLGDKAPRAKKEITGYNASLWDQFGLECYLNGEVLRNGRDLDVEDSLHPIIFTFGEKGANELNTGIHLNVWPNIDNVWYSAKEVEYFEVSGTDTDPSKCDDAQGDYLIVANGDTLVSTKAIDISTLVDEQSSQMSLAAFDGIKVNGQFIADYKAQCEDLEMTKSEIESIVWKIKDSTVEFTDAKEYALTFETKAGGKYMSIASVNNNLQIRDDSWTVTTSTSTKNAANIKWVLSDDGYLYTVVEYIDKTAKPVFDVTTDKYEFPVIPVAVYVAVSDAGYVYLTDDAKAAAKIKVYRISETAAMVDDIEIAKNPTKMEYVEGQRFSNAGMVVNLMYNDMIVTSVPAALFDFYGITTSPANNTTMTVKGNNDRSVIVRFNGINKLPTFNRVALSDETDEKLSVRSADEVNGQLIQGGKLTDGTYAIVWVSDTDTDKLQPKTAYDGLTLVNRSVSAEKNSLFYSKPGASSYSLNTLAVEDVTVFDKGIASDLSNAKWNVKYNATERAFTIQDAASGKYLSRNTATYKDMWVYDYNPGMVKPAYSALTVEQYIASYKTLVLTAECTADSYWLIDGSFDAAIESPAENDDNFYLAPYAAGLAFAIDSSDKKDVNMDNFYFFKLADYEITALKVAEQPTLKYASGDKLDLHALVVEATYTDGTQVLIPYDDFAAYGLTTNVAGDKLLASSDNGTKVVISLGDLSASTDNLVVEDSKAEAKVVRMGGADRYETAAIIANNYITALGAEYKNVAVLVNSERFPDALAGSTLAAALKAPIVISKADSLNAKTKAVLVDNKVNTVYVLGGENAIGANVIAELKALNINVKVIAGADRVATSIAIAKELAAAKGASSDTVIITNGANFADALSVSSAAAKNGTPIIYVNGQGTLSADVKTFIADAKASKAVILGGTAAVSDSIAAELKALGLSVDRAAGKDRFETSVAIAKYFDAAYTDGVVALATGKDFPDALAGGVYASIIGAPVILVDNGYANADAALYIAGLDLTNAVVFGGPEAVSDATVAAALLK